MSSIISIGRTGDMRPVYVLWNGYTDPDVPNEEVGSTLDGSLQLIEGTQRRLYQGQFEISNAFPAGHADVPFLKGLHGEIGSIRFTDHEGTTLDVVWIGPFTEIWVDKGANLVRIPFQLIEVT